MRKRGPYGLLSLTVTDVQVLVDAEAGPRTHTETTESQCAIQFGKPHKVALKHDADGTETTWMEVTVREIEHEERIQKTSSIQLVPAATPADMNDSDISAIDCIAEAVENVMDLIADTASELFGPESPEETHDLRSAEYLEHPPQYIAQP